MQWSVPENGSFVLEIKGHCLLFICTNKYTYIKKGKGKGNVHPVTGDEGSEGE